MFLHPAQAAAGSLVFTEVKPTHLTAQSLKCTAVSVSLQSYVSRIFVILEKPVPLGVLWLTQLWATPFLLFAPMTQPVLDTSFKWNSDLSLPLSFQQGQS